MKNPVDHQQNHNSNTGFKSFAFKRFAIAVILIVAVVWALSVGPGMLDLSTPSVPHHAASEEHPAAEPGKPATPQGTDPGPTEPAAVHSAISASRGSATMPGHDAIKQPHSGAVEEVLSPPQKQAAAKASKTQDPHAPASDQPSPHKDNAAQAYMGKKQPAKTASEPSHIRSAPETQAHDPSTEAVHDEQRPIGFAFVEAVISPLRYELNERFWGWRSNDIVNFTDNVNHFQRGVLEVTRRSVVLLSERISRTGTTAAFNTHLENAMNWLMVKADRYWFPSPESKYRESIKELEKYKQGLINGKASFYIRSDNIIPLLASYEDLLGSSDENLVKQKEKDGASVSFFDADDNFFYAKGVASTMAVILEAVHHDFAKTLKNRHGEELLHHAIESCRQAAALDPLIITDGDLDGIFANHRAHMAAPISHARFYIGQLIKTLST